MSNSQPLISLSHLGLLEITGPDSEKFLQGQLTCDVQALNDQRWSLGACCTAKGRMVANFVIARQGSTFWLRMPREQVPALRQHLAKYAVFFKTTLTDRSEEWSVLGQLPAAGTQPTLLKEPQTLVESAQGLTLHWPDGRYEFWLPTVAASAESGDLSPWLLADIELGLAWVTAASREEWVPQHIEWQIQGGVSFKKGCYTGQEIVARLQYLGKSKKQLVRVQSAGPLELAPLTVLTDSAGKTIGEIANWHQNRGLAVVNGDQLAAQTFAADKSLIICSLFYTEEISEQKQESDL